MRRWILALALLLAACKTNNDDVRTEVLRREAYGRRAALAGDAGRILNVASTSNFIFEEGFSIIRHDPPDNYRNHAFRWMGKNGHVRLKGHDGAPMHLKVTGWVDERVIRARPVIEVSIDGRFIQRIGPIDGGHFWLETVVQPEVLHGADWVDLDIMVSAVAFHWAEPPELQVVVIYGFEWDEAK
jgi:hypothetical protein